MTRDGNVHVWSRLVGNGPTPSQHAVTGFFGRRRAGPGSGQYPTRALSRFVAALVDRPAPVVVDLGPAQGANVTFLGDTLSCTLDIEDLLSDLATWGPLELDAVPSAGLESDAARLCAERERGRRAQAAARILPRVTGSVDGVLGWDLVDHLDEEAARALAQEVVRILRPGGVLFLCHSTDRHSEARLYEIIDAMTLRHRSGPSEWPTRRVWPSRAITDMYSELVICDSFLLTNRMREVVLRKLPAPVVPER